MGKLQGHNPLKQSHSKMDFDSPMYLKPINLFIFGFCLGYYIRGFRQILSSLKYLIPVAIFVETNMKSVLDQFILQRT